MRRIAVIGRHNHRFYAFTTCQRALHDFGHFGASDDTHQFEIIRSAGRLAREQYTTIGETHGLHHRKWSDFEPHAFEGFAGTLWRVDAAHQMVDFQNVVGHVSPGDREALEQGCHLFV